MAHASPLIATIKISRFIRYVYMPYVKIRAKLTGQEPDLDKVMVMVKKFTSITVSRGENYDSGNSSQR